MITKKFVSKATVARDKFVAKIQRAANTKLEQQNSEGNTINEHKQLKQSEETLTTNEVITMMLHAIHEETLAPAEENLNTKPEEKSTTTVQKQPEEIRKEKIASALMNTKEPQPKVHQQEPSTS